MASDSNVPKWPENYDIWSTYVQTLNQKINIFKQITDSE